MRSLQIQECSSWKNYTRSWYKLYWSQTTSGFASFSKAKHLLRNLFPGKNFNSRWYGIGENTSGLSSCSLLPCWLANTDFNSLFYEVFLGRSRSCVVAKCPVASHSSTLNIELLYALLVKTFFDFLLKVLCSGKDYIDKDLAVTICSYDLVTKKLKELEAISYKTIIFDESHLVKCMSNSVSRSKNVVFLMSLLSCYFN